MNIPKAWGRSDGYIAAIISDSSARRLLALAVHPEVYCRHMMIAYRPNDAAWERFGALIGQNKGLLVFGMVQDERAQAVLVDGLQSENQHPHITVSCAHDVQPAYTNQLVARAVAAGAVQPVDIGRRVINAHVKFKPFADYASGSSRRLGWSPPEPDSER